MLVFKNIRKTKQFNYNCLNWKKSCLRWFYMCQFDGAKNEACSSAEVLASADDNAQQR